MPEPFDSGTPSEETSPAAISPDLEDIASQLQGMERRLHNILADKEEDFLQLGSNLMDFSSRSRKITEEVSSLAGLASGEEITGGINELQAFMGTVSSLCQTMTGGGTLEDLSQIIASLHNLKELFQEFARVIKALRMLGISTRIESARLGEYGRGFTSLADDVDKLVARIEESSTEISNRSNEIITTTLKVQGGTKKLLSSQHCLLDQVVSSLAGNIDDLARIVEQSNRISDELIVHSGQISASTSTAVTSLQFHDIVRQQIEHVEECARDAVDLIREYMNAKNPDYSLQQVLTFVLQIAKIQAHQLESGSEQFEKAVLDFKAQVEHIASIVDLFMQAAQGFDARDKGDHGSVLDVIRSSMDQVIANIRHFVSGMQEQQQLIIPVADTVKDMDSAAREVQDLGDEIELISLNASIKSAGVGDKGLAMGVLAHEIQRLSMRTKEHTLQVLKVLAGLAELSKHLQNRSSQEEELNDLESTIKEQEASLGRLVDLKTQMDQFFVSVSSLGHSLGQDIRFFAKGIVLHETICSHLETVREDFIRLISHLEEAHVDPATHLPPKFDELLHRYTMESERIIHQMALGLGEAKDARKKAIPEDTQDIELFDDQEDGVELFGSDEDGVELFGDDDNVELF
jgi:methyl-accepting chemotaxis protein